MNISRSKDFLISVGIALFTILLILLVTSSPFLDFSSSNLLISGFIKFFLLATIGEIIGSRIRIKKWQIPNYIIVKAIIWGIIGVVIVLMFNVFSTGTLYLQSINVLPYDGSTFAFAFFTSLLMNITFAPSMMIFHRFTDSYLELRTKNKRTSFNETVEFIDWKNFFGLIILRTIPLFWIPAHTITFLMPNEYRVIFAAILGIFLGVILSIFNRKAKHKI